MDVLGNDFSVNSDQCCLICIECFCYYAAYSPFLDWHLQSRRHVGHFSGSQAVSFKPPASWSDLVLDKNLIDMLFMVIGSFYIKFATQSIEHKWVLVQFLSPGPCLTVCLSLCPVHCGKWLVGSRYRLRWWVGWIPGWGR